MCEVTVWVMHSECNQRGQPITGRVGRVFAGCGCWKKKNKNSSVLPAAAVGPDRCRANKEDGKLSLGEYQQTQRAPWVTAAALQGQTEPFTGRSRRPGQFLTRRLGHVRKVNCHIVFSDVVLFASLIIMYERRLRTVLLVFIFYEASFLASIELQHNGKIKYWTVFDAFELFQETRDSKPCRYFICLLLAYNYVCIVCSGFQRARC